MTKRRVFNILNAKGMHRGHIFSAHDPERPDQRMDDQSLYRVTSVHGSKVKAKNVSVSHVV